MSYKKFTKDIGFVEVTHLITAAKALVFIPIIIKQLGAEAFGIWIQLTVSIGLITPIATLGLPYAMVRFLANEKDKKQIQNDLYSVLCIIFAIAVVIGSGLILLAQPISTFFGAKSPALIKILALVILFECLNLVFLNIFRAFQQIRKYSLFTVLQTIGEVGLVSAMILSERGLVMAVMALLVVRILVFLLMGAFITKEIGITIPNFAKTRKYLSFSLPTIPNNISSWIIQSSDKFMISYFLGTMFVGHYGPAHTIGNIIFLLIFPFSFTLPAVLSKLYDENNLSQVKRYLKYSLKYLLLITIPAVFGISTLAKSLLTALSTETISQHSFLVIPIIAFSILLRGNYAIFLQPIILKKKTTLIGTIWVIAAFLNLSLNFVLIPAIGIIGAAVATLIAYIFSFIIMCYYSHREISFNVDWKFITKSICASLLMSMCIAWFQPKGLFQIGISIFSGILLYAVFILLFQGLTKQEIRFFKQLIREIKI